MSKKFQVVITDFLKDALEPEQKVLGDIADIVALDAHDEAELVGQIEHADAVILYHNLALSAKTVGALKQCRVIVRGGVGYDNVDWRLARQMGIPVTNVPDYGTEEVADSAIGMMLSLTRGIALMNSRLRAAEGPWMYWQAVPLERHRGKTIGLIGLGRIGTAMALRAQALGMDVAYYDPYCNDGFDKALGVRRVEKLDDLLAQSWVVSLHCPLTDENRGSINAAAVAKMPRGSYLVNTARGGLIDVSCIPPAIESGQLAGAAIDVLPDEPPSPDNPLIKAWRDPKHPAHHRVLVNPHAAFYCEQGLMEMRVKGAQSVRRALLGERLRNVVN